MVGLRDFPPYGWKADCKVIPMRKKRAIRPVLRAAVRGAGGLPGLLLTLLLGCAGAWAAPGAAGDAAAAPAPAAAPSGAPAGLPPYALGFDALRDPAADFELALAAAKQHGRRVLVLVGGDWCVWCFLLDRHLRDDPEAAAAFYGGFEVLRVYYSDDNTNEPFLSRFPEFETFPHFFVVETDGRVLASVDAPVLISDAKYQTALIRAFAEHWRK